MKDWEKLHANSVVVDLHNHAVLKRFLLDRDLSSSKTKLLAGMFKRAFWPLSQRSTFPLLKRGGVDVVLSTCYIPEREWLDDQKLVKLALALAPEVRRRVFDPFYFDATVNMIDDMEKQVDEHNSKISAEEKAICVAKTRQELQQIIDIDGDVALIHSVEGAHSLEGFECEDSNDMKIKEAEVLQNLEYLFDRGVAYLTLAHFYPNLSAYPVFPYPNYGIKSNNWKKLMAGWDMNQGLTDIGRSVVKRMLEIGMLIDISHCTPKTRSEIYEIVGDRKNCLLASHTGAFEINRDPYNLEDWELKWFADHDCVVGIIFMNYWISPVDNSLGLKYIEQTIDHIRNVSGSQVLGIGTDFDGFTDPPDEITDMSELPRITRYLHSLNRYSDQELELFLGKNALRLLMNGWKR